MTVVCALQPIPNQGAHTREDLFSIALTPMGLIRLLWQVLDIDMQEARGVVLEGLERLDLALDLRLQALELGDLVAAQAPVQS